MDGKPLDTSYNEHVKALKGLLFLVIILFPFTVFGMSWLLFKFVIEYLPFWVSAVIAIFMCVVGIGLIVRETEDFLKKDSLWARVEKRIPMACFLMSISMSLTSIGVLITIGAWVSLTLWKLDLANLFTDCTVLNYSILVKTYAWHLMDLIPFTNVERTFGMKVPMLQFEGWIAGAPIFFFRFLVVLIVFNIIRESYQRLKRNIEDESNNQ